ncbi:MAG: hypothetical protein CME64_07215 [Halobacteriovoraceae bacterium]|nr:hypothetical protein [Halobacteriovoraceae bacterium]|tara:strand:+ start:61695 stop:62138 length:444 start_codon:yes stop_codon:yes gene_type:complete
MNKFFTFCLIVLFGACSPSPKTPDGLLKMVIKDVATKELSKDYFLKHTSGELKSSIEAMDDEELKRSDLLKSISGTKTKILNETCQENSCSITYVVSYKSSKESSFSTETKKIAQLEKVEDKWKISKITHLKTFHEANEPINALEEN